MKCILTSCTALQVRFLLRTHPPEFVMRIYVWHFDFCAERQASSYSGLWGPCVVIELGIESLWVTNLNFQGRVQKEIWNVSLLLQESGWGLKLTATAKTFSCFSYYPYTDATKNVFKALTRFAHLFCHKFEKTYHLFRSLLTFRAFSPTAKWTPWSSVSDDQKAEGALQVLLDLFQLNLH